MATNKRLISNKSVIKVYPVSLKCNLFLVTRIKLLFFHSFKSLVYYSTNARSDNQLNLVSNLFHMANPIVLVPTNVPLLAYNTKKDNVS